MMMRRVWSLVLMFAGVALLRPVHVMGQGEMFELGNQLYQEDDFAGAIEAYEAVLEVGWESPDLYYNLGNSYFKFGDLGRSILHCIGWNSRGGSAHPGAHRRTIDRRSSTP